ncbi:uncharacterized protein aq_928-like [Glandiceps talaboti]
MFGFKQLAHRQAVAGNLRRTTANIWNMVSVVNFSNDEYKGSQQAPAQQQIINPSSGLTSCNSHEKLKMDVRQMQKVSVYDILCAAITPRPIAFVSTCSTDGKVKNLAMFSFFMPVTSEPPTLAFSITRKRDDSMKDTLVNILETKHFVVNHCASSVFDKGYQGKPYIHTQFTR